MAPQVRHSADVPSARASMDTRLMPTEGYPQHMMLEVTILEAKGLPRANDLACRIIIDGTLYARTLAVRGDTVGLRVIE